MTELSDELLVAYVDGQLARKQTHAVERVLEQDDVIARRVKALQDAHSRLEAAFEAILAGEELVVAKPERAGFFVPWVTALKIGLAGAGLAASLVMMIAGYGWPLSMPDFARSSGLTDPEYTGSIAPTWQETAARAQGLLSRESLEVGLEGQGNLDLVALQLGQAVGPGLKLPNLDRDGYRFVRAQLLRSGEEPLAQLLYLGTSGAPLALYAKRGAESEAPSFKRYGGMGSVAWSEDGISYLLAGEADEPALMQLAERIRSGPQTAGSEGAKADSATPPTTPLTAGGARP
jgi:anti-sigma factor RsiW